MWAECCQMIHNKVRVLLYTYHESPVDFPHERNLSRVCLRLSASVVRIFQCRRLDVSEFDALFNPLGGLLVVDFGLWCYVHLDQ
jgi:hypothetical protein